MCVTLPPTILSILPLFMQLNIQTRSSSLTSLCTSISRLSCGEEMSKNSSLPSQEQQETSELIGSGGGRGKGIRGPMPFVPVGDKRGAFCPGWWLQPGQKAARAFCPSWRHQPGQNGGLTNRDKWPAQPFVPVGATNRDKRPPFCPGWCLQPGQNSLAPYPLPSSPARAIQLTYSCCSWLGRGEFLLISSPHL